jgi:hypothetical protein
MEHEETMEKDCIRKKITHYKPLGSKHFKFAKGNFTGKENQYWRRTLKADNNDEI